MKLALSTHNVKVGTDPWCNRLSKVFQKILLLMQLAFTFQILLGYTKNTPAT